MSEHDSTVIKVVTSKRVYQVPKLLSLGSFHALTLGSTGTKNDGGGRQTKQSVAL